jgi:hypothetical protein
MNEFHVFLFSAIAAKSLCRFLIFLYQTPNIKLYEYMNRRLFVFCFKECCLVPLCFLLIFCLFCFTLYFWLIILGYAVFASADIY